MNNKIKKPAFFLVCLTATLATLSACSKKTTKANTTTTQTIKTTEKKTTAKPTTTKKAPTGNPKVFFIVDGEISEYKYEKASEALEFLLDKSNEYLTGAVNGDTTYVGDYYYTDIIREDGYTYSITFNALFHILSNNGYEEKAQEIRNKSYLHSSSKIKISTESYKITFAIDEGYDRIINYYLTIDEDGNLVLDMFKQ